MKEKVQKLNYSSHALEDLQKTKFDVDKICVESGFVINEIMNALDSSVKFILPNCSELLDPTKVSQTHMDLVRLPYPIVSFEAPWVMEKGISHSSNEEVSTKRIALCWEILPGQNPVPSLSRFVDDKVDDFENGGVFVCSIYWANYLKQWNLASGGSFLPHGFSLIENANIPFDPVSSSVNKKLLRAGIVKSNGVIMTQRALPLMSPKVTNDSSLDETTKRIILDTRDEVSMLVGACSVINCHNVQLEDLPASRVLNDKRRRNGKKPLFSYKILQLTDDKTSGSNKRGLGKGTSPRMHLRRGHLRRTSKTTWISPTMVRPGGPGFVSKDYSVKKPES